MLSFFFFVPMPAHSPSAAQQIDMYQKTVLTQPTALLPHGRAAVAPGVSSCAGERRWRLGPPPPRVSGSRFASSSSSPHAVSGPSTAYWRREATGLLRSVAGSCAAAHGGAVVVNIGKRICRMMNDIMGEIISEQSSSFPVSERRWSCRPPHTRASGVGTHRLGPPPPRASSSGARISSLVGQQQGR